MLLLLVSLIAAGAVYKLSQVNKQKQIAYNKYMDDRVVNQRVPQFLIGPDGTKHPTWCPNCGKNL